ncbi:GIY-YIG nuclease family protein [Yersinia enterocolitica]|nr:GIY-YIG nuclease family protein [Yersinia enterocolitica]
MPSTRRERQGGRVYVATDGQLIKIGMSTRGKCLSRFSELKNQFGFSVVDSFITERRFDYRLIEQEAHERLSAFRLNNEFFSASFADGVRAVNEVISEMDSHGFSGSVKP